jgi:two-component system, cell cycle sensor histidine kinase PleC
MARFNASSAPISADKVSGLASAVAHPQYLEKLRAEPWVRRLVPFLVIIFLGATWAGTILQLANDRTRLLMERMDELETVSALVAIDMQIEMERMTRENKLQERRELDRGLIAALGSNTFNKGIVAHLADTNDRVIATTDKSATGLRFSSLLQGGNELFAQSDKAGVRYTTMSNGAKAMATVRVVAPDHGRLLMARPLDNILDPWRKRAISTALLALATTIIIAAMAKAYFEQLSRANEADDIYARVRRRVDLVLTSGQSGLWDLDLSRMQLFFSDSLYQIIGRTRGAEFISFDWVADFIHPDDHNPFNTAMDRLLDEDDMVEQEFRMLHECGEWRWIRIRGQRIDDNGRPHVVGIAIDITAEKQAAAQRQQHDTRLHDAIESISEAFALFDDQKRLLISNSKFANLAKKTRVAPAQDSKDMRLPLLCPAPIQLVTCDITGNRSYGLQLDNSQWYQINERRTKDGGQVLVGTDITQHKTYETTLASTNMMLETMVANLERTKDEYKRQATTLQRLAENLLEQKAAAESANIAKGEFLANMSHELRTPLNHVIGFSEMMQAGVFGALGHERYQEYAKNINESGQYLLMMIEDILSMSNLESGRYRLEREKVSLADILDKAVHTNHEAAIAKNVAVNLHRPKPMHIIGDQKALSQMLGNLVNNAVKFAPHGGKVEVRARRSQASIHIMIADNGPGIARDQISRVSKPFEQLGGTLENGFKGTGLGLSIAKTLCELHGGSLHIRSKEHQGTAVLLRLPLLGARALVNELTRH